MDDYLDEIKALKFKLDDLFGRIDEDFMNLEVGSTMHMDRVMHNLDLLSHQVSEVKKTLKV